MWLQDVPMCRLLAMLLEARPLDKLPNSVGGLQPDTRTNSVHDLDQKKLVGIWLSPDTSKNTTRQKSKQKKTVGDVFSTNKLKIVWKKNVPARHISPLTEMNPSPKRKQKKIAFRIGQPGACIIEWPYLPKCWAGMSWSITICCHGIFRTWAPSGSLQGEMRPALSQTHSHFATENRVETQNEWIVFFQSSKFLGYIYIWYIC